jgi:predicted metal-binding protein
MTVMSLIECGRMGGTLKMMMIKLLSASNERIESDSSGDERLLA